MRDNPPGHRIAVPATLKALRADLLDALAGRGHQPVVVASDAQARAEACGLRLVAIPSGHALEPALTDCAHWELPTLVLVGDATQQREAFATVASRHDVERLDAGSAIVLARLAFLAHRHAALHAAGQHAQAPEDPSHGSPAPSDEPDRARAAAARTAHGLPDCVHDLVRDAQRAADQDKLTQVWNRAYFDRRFARELELSTQQGTPLSIVVFDLDRFGQFSREHGMPTADAVLQQFCRLAGTCIRASDWIARYGGEEFVLVVRGPLAEAMQAAERVRREFELLEIATPDGRRVQATVSAGVVQSTEVEPTPDAVIRAGSQRLQRAKRQGRNRVVCTDDG